MPTQKNYVLLPLLILLHQHHLCRMGHVQMLPNTKSQTLTSQCQMKETCTWRHQCATNLPNFHQWHEELFFLKICSITCLQSVNCVMLDAQSSLIKMEWTPTQRDNLPMVAESTVTTVACAAHRQRSITTILPTSISELHLTFLQ